MKQNTAIFIDRDGTLIEEMDHLVSVEEIALFPHSIEAIRKVNSQGILAILVTNQSVVARGLLTERQLRYIHDSLLTLLNQNGAELDAIYYCPHHPREGSGPLTIECSCRKPKPGMLQRAAADFALDLNRCVMIGDSLGDVEAGHLAGASSVLVRTGHGAEAVTRIQTDSESRKAQWYPDYIASDILHAVNWSLEKISE
jgi:D-glycero-D-manno-heptose 1,7-bisphosphate phosphatase